MARLSTDAIELQGQHDVTTSDVTYSSNGTGCDTAHAGISEESAKESVNATGLPVKVDTGHGTSGTHGQIDSTTHEASRPQNATLITISDTDEWRSPWLRRGRLVPVIAVTSALLCVLLILTIWSARHNGITAIENSGGTTLLGSFQIGEALAWTVIPVLILQAYGFLIAAVVAAAAFRQPFVELRKNQKLRKSQTVSDVGASARKSILLDYGSYFVIKQPWKALQNGHYTLCVSFIGFLLLNFAITPLAAHLFVTKVVLTTSDIAFERRHAFDEDAIATANIRISITPVLGIVSSTLLYGGSPVSWTTFKKAYVPFSIADGDTSTSSRNVTAPALAYGVALDCVVLDANNFELALAPSGQWFFNIRDRGCSQSNQLFDIPVGSYHQQYAAFLNNQNCSPESGWSRDYIVVAQGNQTELANKTAISCIPTWYNSSGMLDTLLPAHATRAPVLYGFAEEQVHKTEIEPNFGFDFENRLTGPTTIDDTGQMVTNNGFAQLIVNYAAILSPEEYLTGGPLNEAITALFPAAYAVFSKLYFITRSPPETVEGTLNISATRVVVVQALAYVTLIVLALVLGILIQLHQYSAAHRSVLYEEPTAIVGWARVLLHSEVMDWAADAVKDVVKDGTAEKSFREWFYARSKDHRWQLRHWSTPEVAALRTVASPTGTSKVDAD